MTWRILPDRAGRWCVLGPDGALLFRGSADEAAAWKAARQSPPLPTPEPVDEPEDVSEPDGP